MLKRLRLLTIREGEIVDQSPRTILIGVDGVASIVFRKAALEVGGCAHVVAASIFFAFQNVNIKHTDLLIGENG